MVSLYICTVSLVHTSYNLPNFSTKRLSRNTFWRWISTVCLYVCKLNAVHLFIFYIVLSKSVKKYLTSVLFWYYRTILTNANFLNNLICLQYNDNLIVERKLSGFMATVTWTISILTAKGHILHPYIICVLLIIMFTAAIYRISANVFFTMNT